MPGCLLTLDSKASRAEPSMQHSAWAILAITATGAFITALDQTVVVTALPSVMLDLKIPITELDRVSWIITAYLLGYTVAMPLIGRIGDVYGYPRVYQASLIVFCIGTSLVAIAHSFEFMIGARVIQAIGGGATVPLGMALATTLVPPEKRALALGVVGGAAEAGSMLGPAYGGAIVELSSWRWIFWLNVPQSAIVFVALMRLPNHRTPGARVDYVGGALLIAALFLLAMGLSRKDFFTIETPWPFILAASGLGVGGVLMLVERRVWQPLLAHVFLRSWQFILANISQALVGVSLILAMVTVPTHRRHGDAEGPVHRRALALADDRRDPHCVGHRGLDAALGRGSHPDGRGAADGGGRACSCALLGSSALTIRSSPCSCCWPAWASAW